MINDISKIGNTGKNFDFVNGDNFLTIKIFELSLIDLDEITKTFVETLKTEEHKNIISFAANLPKEDRMEYMVKASKEFKIDIKKINEIWDTEFAAVTCLKRAAKESKDLNWSELFLNNPDQCILAYLYCLGQDISEFDKDNKEEILKKN